MLNTTMEDYLKAIYILQEESDDRVTTSALAEYMGVEPSTVTSMMKKLAEREFVHYESYKGVELTDAGTSVALEIIRHHRLLERYLTEHLEYDWSEVHDEADRLEHHISDQFVERVAELLGDPEIDPHGDPIPTAELVPSSTDSHSLLVHCSRGDYVRIERVSDRDPEVLQYLADHGIKPGVTAEVLEVAPFGMVTLQLDSEEESVALPEEIATLVYAQQVARPVD